MAKGESTKRSQLDADSITGVLRETGAATLQDEEELMLILDGMELRKPHAHQQESLMEVKALDGRLVNGYRSFTVLGLGAHQQRGILYHRLFSSQAAGFRSENEEAKQAILTSEASLTSFEGPKTWVLDRGFDNQTIWWTIWEQTTSHVVCRLYHFERIVLWQTPEGAWEERYLDATFKEMKTLYQGQTTMLVRLDGQQQAKRQKVLIRIEAVAIRLRHPDDPSHTKDVWLVRIHIPGSNLDPWVVMTDWPVETAEDARRIFRFYRRRWSIEDTFKFVKTCFGIEDVQMLTFEAVRTLVALAWVAAGFLFHLGLTLDSDEVQLLARLGGWDQRPDHPPGKLTLTRGLRRLLDRFATEAILADHRRIHGALPDFVQRLHDAFEPDD